MQISKNIQDDSAEALAVPTSLLDITSWFATRFSIRFRSHVHSSRTSPSIPHIGKIRIVAQNSILPWKAIMRGELSPPSPTPSSPVGGEIVLVIAPKPVWVAGSPGVPA